MTSLDPRSSLDPSRPRSSADEPIDLQRYGSALRRGWRWITAAVVLAVAVAAAGSLLAESRYRAQTKIVYETLGGSLDGRDINWVQRELQTIRSLAGTRAVLEAAALRTRLDADTIEKNTKTRVDPNANIITVEATDTDPERAAAMANAVASSFLVLRRDTERNRLLRARAALRRELARLDATAGSAAQRTALRTRISELDILIATAGSELRVVQAARAPKQPYAPRVVRNSIIALFAALFAAVLVVIARDQLRPRMGDARELSQVLAAPIVARIPFLPARERRDGILAGAEYDASHALAAALKLNAAHSSQSIVLVTSATEGEGKSRVSAALGVALAQSGSPTLLVSADLRSPTLHEFFGVQPDGGLSEALSSSRWSGSAAVRIESSIRVLRPNLALLASGGKRTNAPSLLAPEALDEVFRELRGFPYEFVIVDAPPLLGLVDAHVLAQFATGILVVSRLHHLTPEDALDMRDTLAQLESPVIGLVVIGAKPRQHTNYYMSGPTSVFDSA